MEVAASLDEARWSGFIASPLVKGMIYYPCLDEAANLINTGSTIASSAVCKRILEASYGCTTSVAVCPVFVVQPKVVQFYDFT